MTFFIQQVLTVLHGPSTLNKTIEYEFTDFQELLALDIQGYVRKLHSNGTYSEVFLHHNALRQKQKLRFLNIEYIRLFPNPNSTAKEIPAEVYAHYADGMIPQRYQFNVTFIQPTEPEIVPYNEYKKQKSIISTFNHLTNLKYLRLFRCHLDSITWEMFDGLINVRMLSLEGNELIEIPQFAFYGMPELRSLILSDNNLERIHNNSFAGLFKLESLDLSGNSLKHLSDLTFAPLPRLQEMGLLRNPLENIFSNTFEIVNMTVYLKIGSTNSLTIYLNTFAGLKHLKKLELLGINTTTLDKNVLRGMPNLQKLRIKGRIDYITFDTFADFHLLQELILKNCSIRDISMDAFYGLQKLERLDLSRNELITLPPGIFDQMNSLEELILSHNKLVTVPSSVFQNLQNVKMIRLEGNFWNCSCEMTNWGLLNLNKEKNTRVVHQCTYQYDKSPCILDEKVFYIYNSRVIPRCFTPTKYKDWNVLYVVNNVLHCTTKRKQITKKLKMKSNNLLYSNIETRIHRNKIQTGNITISGEIPPTPNNLSYGTDYHNQSFTTLINSLKNEKFISEVVTKPITVIRNQENVELDNDLGELSQFLDRNENYGPEYRSHKKKILY